MATQWCATDYLVFNNHTTNVAAGWVALLFGIREGQCSSLGTETGYIKPFGVFLSS